MDRVLIFFWMMFGLSVLIEIGVFCLILFGPESLLTPWTMFGFLSLTGGLVFGLVFLGRFTPLVKERSDVG